MAQNHAAGAPQQDLGAERQSPTVPATRTIFNIILRGYCPRCASDRAHRSHRRSVFERILAMAILPYRCEYCSFRFFRFRWRDAER